MPKLKRGTKRVARHEHGKQQKGGKQGAQEPTSSKPTAKPRAAAPPAPPTVDEAAPVDEDLPAAAPSRKPSKPAVHKRKRRDEQPASVQRRKLAKDASKISRDLGASAEGRHSAFAREGRSDASAARLAQYHAQQAAQHVKKLARKGKTAEAAAALGGLVRDPDVRQLNQAAGVQLSEDASVDTQMVDNLASGTATFRHTSPGTSHAGTSQTRRRRWSQSSSCCTLASTWPRPRSRRAARRRSSARRSRWARSRCRAIGGRPRCDDGGAQAPAWRRVEACKECL